MGWGRCLNKPGAGEAEMLANQRASHSLGFFFHLLQIDSALLASINEVVSAVPYSGLT